MPQSGLAAGLHLYVSGVGDDANPCSRTSPCKTFAGALVRETGPGGEIDALDAGGFGQVTVNTGVMLSGAGTSAEILATGGTGINVTAPAGSTVILNHLDINGNGSGTNGISVTLDAIDSTIHDNAGNGLLAMGGSVTLEGDTFDGNTCGVAVASTGSTNFATNCGTGAAGGTGTPTVDASNTTIAGNHGFGLLVNGANASADIAGATVTANGTGLSAQNGGQIAAAGTGNVVFGNGTDGAPASTTGSQVAQGATGPAGPQGVPGPSAPSGSAGPAGPAGQIEPVTCAARTKVKHVRHKTKQFRIRSCTSKLVSGTTTFRAAHVG